MDEDNDHARYMTSRHTRKTGDQLMEAAGNCPELLTDAQKREYMETPERDSPITYVMETRKGELLNEHPEPTTNPVIFNKQVSDSDLAALRKRCSNRQYGEAVKMLSEFNFSTEEALQQVKTKSRPTPCFECGVSRCLRRQERWQGRVLHGCYPNVPLLNFQHDKSDSMPSCYFVYEEKNDPLFDKFKDAVKVFKLIESTGSG